MIAMLSIVGYHKTCKHSHDVNKPLSFVCNTFVLTQNSAPTVSSNTRYIHI